MTFASVEKIKDIIPIEGSDKLAKILLSNGGVTVAPKDSFSKEELVCWLCAETNVNKSLIDGFKRNRTRIRKIFNIESLGVIFPISKIKTIDEKENIYIGKDLDRFLWATPSPQFLSIAGKLSYIMRSNKPETYKKESSLEKPSSIYKYANYGTFAGTSFNKKECITSDSVRQIRRTINSSNSYPIDIIGLPVGELVAIEVDHGYPIAYSPKIEGKVYPTDVSVIDDLRGRLKHELIRNLRMLQSELQTFDINEKFKIYGIIPEFILNKNEPANIQDKFQYSLLAYAIVINGSYVYVRNQTVARIANILDLVPVYESIASYSDLFTKYKNIDEKIANVLNVGSSVSLEWDVVKLIGVLNQVSNKPVVGDPNDIFSSIPAVLRNRTIKIQTTVAMSKSSSFVEDANYNGFRPLFVVRDYKTIDKIPETIVEHIYT